ncbi:hypothetical protein BDV59DRAFT_201525 [Aspergillus ambiguus]|uniref:uncharacterized protein n=1 Tax=Aspergillus ambiguus TaxID=176160 RepID=UPI003CCD2DE8
MSNPAPADPAPSEASLSFVLHILCPSLPPPNRFTFKDLTASHTLRDLKSRISQAIPTRPPPETQRLIYRGKPLAHDGATLQLVLDPENGSEYTMHLVLPPAPLSQTPTPTPPASAPPLSPTGLPTHQSPFAPSRSVPPTFMPNAQGLRYRGPTAPAVPNEAEISLALQRNIEAIRRQVEHLERRGTSLLGQQRTMESSLNSIASQHPTWQRAPQGFPHPPPTMTTTSPFTPTGASFTFGSPEDRRARLHLLQPQIALCEEQLSRGIAPPMDQIIRLRSQLFALLDEQYRNPNAERDGTIESLLSRVFNVYTRADQLRVTQSQTTTPVNIQADSLPSSGANTTQTQPPLYLLSSPTGYQAIVSPRGPETLHPALEALRAAQAAQSPAFPGLAQHQHHHNAHHNAHHDAMVNAVRQAVINNQRVAVNNDQLGLARNVRRVWLFVRLYFFCYMFSEPGTWARVLLVALAVLVAVLSETTVPHQLYRTLVSPVQRHLESLVHHLPEEPAAAAAAAGPPADAPIRASFPAELRRNLRRVERSVALFMASLVPGVGERHVEVQNAAEAARNAERAREEEERRRQEEAEQRGAQNAEDTTTTSTAADDTPTIPTGEEHEGR